MSACSVSQLPRVLNTSPTTSNLVVVQCSCSHRWASLSLTAASLAYQLVPAAAISHLSTSPSGWSTSPAAG
ncbi:hypothetical protein ABBQ38_014831 [Trebouxia sp. C0009 RCD-2024]